MCDLNELTNLNKKKGEQILPNSKFQRMNEFLSRTNVEFVCVIGLILRGKKGFIRTSSMKGWTGR